MVVGARVQEIVFVWHIPLNMEQNLVVGTVLVVPRERQGLVLIKGARGVPEEPDLFIFIFCILVLFDLLESHATSAEEVAVFAVELVCINNLPGSLSQIDDFEHGSSERAKILNLGSVLEARGSIELSVDKIFHLFKTILDSEKVYLPGR